MDDEKEQDLPILAVAWRHYAEIELASRLMANRHRLWRYLAAFLLLVAITLAIGIEQFGAISSSPLVSWTLKILLILTPLVGAVIAAFIHRFASIGEAQVLSSGAGQIQREVFIYRTILSNHPDRERWLKASLETIQKQISLRTGHTIAYQPYHGLLPPFQDPDDKGRDNGFKDLSGEEYVQYRLENQLAAHILKLDQAERARSPIQVSLLIVGLAAALLAFLGQNWSLWVAPAASLVLAFLGWDALSHFDLVAKDCRRVIAELNLVRDRWLGLEPGAKNVTEFHNMVRSVEDILCYQKMGFAEPSPLASLPGESEPASPGTLEIAPQQESSPEMTLSHTLQKIADDFSSLELTKETPKEILHQVIAQFPASGEIKG